MSEIVRNCPKNNEKSHNYLIKMTFSKKMEMCVCKTLF